MTRRAARTSALAGALAVGLVAPAPPAIRSAAAQERPADLLVVNADVVTLDARIPRASALAVRDGFVVGVGSEASLGRYRGVRTEVLDVRGRAVLPGFVDSHLHLVEHGQSLVTPRLTELDRDALEARLRGVPADGEIHRFLGWGAYPRDGDAFPTRELLDSWVGDAAVVLERGDGHVGLFSRGALARLGIETLVAERGLPPEHVERRADGSPNGILVEEAYWAAMEEMDRHLSAAERRAAVDTALIELARFGVTSVRNILFTPAVLGTYAELYREGRLTVRIDAAILGRRPAEAKRAAIAALAEGVDRSWLALSAAKYFADGALGPGTGALLEPYDYDPERFGIIHWESGADLAVYLLDDLEIGLQSMVHAMGDRAARLALDAFEAVVERRGPADYRFRIEHGNMPTPDDFERWARLPVVWSYQPPAWTEEYRQFRRRALGERRLEYSENVEAFLARGMPVAVGSDAPYYVSLNPLENVESLAARHAHNASYPRHVPVHRALEMVTIGAAYAARQERSRGTLTEGKLADFVVLSANPLGTPPEEIGAITVERTVVGGRTVWVRER